MHAFSTARASPERLRAVRELLDDAFGGDFAEEDWEHTLGGWHVAITQGRSVVSHAAVVPRRLEIGERAVRAGYVEGVATAPGAQRSGLGSRVMTRLAAIVRAEFELGALSTDRHRFYGRLGWERWQGPSFVRRADEVVRTPDEDDGIMVLRFGPSRDVDLAAAIVCEARTGDDW